MSLSSGTTTIGGWHDALGGTAAGLAGLQSTAYIGQQPIIYPDRNQSSDIAKLAEALALAQGEFDTAHKSSDNPFYSSKYADLAEVWRAIRGPLSKHGLSVVQCPVSDGASVTVKTTLMHSSGQWISGSMTMKGKLDKNGDITPQALGSLISYCRRYALQSMVGIASQNEDDDGNKASGVAPVKSEPKEAAAKRKKLKVSESADPEEFQGLINTLTLAGCRKNHQEDCDAVLSYLIPNWTLQFVHGEKGAAKRVHEAITQKQTQEGHTLETLYRTAMQAAGLMDESDMEKQAKDFF